MIFSIFLMINILLTGCENGAAANMGMSYTADTKVWDVINDPVFKGYGRLIFPVDRTIDKRATLREVGSILTFYNYVNTARTSRNRKLYENQSSFGCPDFLRYLHG
jgi:hypothetical protein